jgi:hypothetical protein
VTLSLHSLLIITSSLLHEGIHSAYMAAKYINQSPYRHIWQCDKKGADNSRFLFAFDQILANLQQLVVGRVSLHTLMINRIIIH